VRPSASAAWRRPSGPKSRDNVARSDCRRGASPSPPAPAKATFHAGSFRGLDDAQLERRLVRGTRARGKRHLHHRQQDHRRRVRVFRQAARPLDLVRDRRDDPQVRLDEVELPPSVLARSRCCGSAARR
jgi:hypothetical protein